MTDHGTSPGPVLDRLKRVQNLSRDLPLESRESAPATRSLFDPALVDSPDIGPLTTPFEQSTKAPPAPRIVGHYQVVSILGRGGMGMVFKGQDARLNRTVAIKMLLGGATMDPRISKRFAVEAEALARLEHPNIVPVYEAGEWEDVPYFAMKFVSGGTLAENAPRIRQDARAAVKIMAKVARAVGYLHEQGISHRDLKPANILLGDGDEPLVADFGLAKFHDTDSGLTMTGVLLGTRFYMSPEQTRGLKDSLTPACDIWSVGVILYELLSGNLPFRSEEYEELFRQIRVDDPPPLKAADGTPLGDLENVVARCLAKNPADRYATANDLADDLDRWLAGQKVAAPTPTPRRRRTWPWILLVSSPFILGLIALAAMLLWPDSKDGRGPVTAPVVLIGKSGEKVEYDPIVETKPVVGTDKQGHFTLSGEDVAIVQLTTNFFPQGTRVEASVKQLSISSDLSFAGIYVRGKMNPGLKGRTIDLATLRVKCLESVKGANQIQFDAAGVYLDIARWDPAQRQTFNPAPVGKPIPLSSVPAGNGAEGSAVRLRIDIAPDGTLTPLVDDKYPMMLADPAEQKKKLTLSVLRHQPRPALEDAPFGDGIGLIVEHCKAAFWDVTIQPLPGK